jgi:hypothetical protein
MKISLDHSDLQQAVEVITKTAPPTSGNITVSSAGGRIVLISAADLSRCQVTVPGEVDKDGEFALPLQSLKDAVKGREKLELHYTNSVLNVTAGKYKAELATVDVVALDTMNAEETTEWKMTATQADWLHQTIKKVALKPTSILSSWIPVGVTLTAQGAFVCCYDTQHMSWVSAKDVTGDFECVLPLNILGPVVEVFHKTNFVVRQSKSSVTVKNKLATVTLSVPSMDDLPSLADVRAKVLEAGKTKGETFTLKKPDVLAFLDNARAVIGKERAELECKAEKSIVFSVKTTQGNVKAALPGSGKGAWKVDMEFFLELMGKADADIEMNVVEGAFLSVKAKSVSAIVALNQ